MMVIVKEFLDEIGNDRPGDLWLCGPYRVLDGDATNPEHVIRSIPMFPYPFVA